MENQKEERDIEAQRAGKGEKIARERKKGHVEPRHRVETAERRLESQKGKLTNQQERR